MACLKPDRGFEISFNLRGECRIVGPTPRSGRIKSDGEAMARRFSQPDVAVDDGVAKAVSKEATHFPQNLPGEGSSAVEEGGHGTDREGSGPLALQGRDGPQQSGHSVEGEEAGLDRHQSKIACNEGAGGGKAHMRGAIEHHIRP